MTTDAAGAAAEPTVQTQAQPGGQPDYKALYESSLKEVDTWRTRFTGLQGKYQQEQAKWVADAGKLTDLDGQFKTLTGEREALALEIGTLKKSVGDLSGAQSALQAQHDRLRLIATEYPALLGYEKDGLLPAGSGDELKALLGKFVERLKVQGLSNTAADGATPPAPQAAAPTRESLMAEIRVAQDKGDTAAYEAAYNKLLNLK
jgi:hypothetical protein